MTRRGPRPVLIRRINLWWYLVALVPIAGLFLVAANGYIPFEFMLVASFLLVFWLTSLGFALFAMVTKKKDLRQ